MLLPIVLRLLARFEGIPKKTGLELSLMSRYFTFQVIHSFLIVSLASGLISALPDLVKNPTSVPTLLAQNLPQASTFFLTYVILQGLAGTAAGFLQAVPLILHYVKLILAGSTPRAAYGAKFVLRDVAWGTLWPGIMLLTVVALGYMIISPIINGLACATFFAFYMMYKYLFLWQFGQPPSSDTGGLYFPKAISHLFVGLYVQQVCLCALFFLSRDENLKASAVPEGALMVVLIIFTALYHMLINNSYGPLIHALPLTLADKTYGAAPEVAATTQADGLHAKDFGGADEQVSADKDKGISTAPSAPNPEAAKQYRSEAEYGFLHPAASRPQRVVWLPLDRLGLVREEQKGNEEAGVETSVQNAQMDEKGKVDISGPPPDEIEEE